MPKGDAILENGEGSPWQTVVMTPHSETQLLVLGNELTK